jgi:alpha 1,3-glucosidase
MWVNSASSYIDVIFDDDDSSFLGITSESGQIDFFIFASAQSPKKIVQDVAIITGYAPLPPIYSLGFHYSEWSMINSTMLSDRDNKFEELGFPVDVYWMDIEYN